MMPQQLVLQSTPCSISPGQSVLQSTLLRVGHSSPVDVRKLRDEKQQQLQFHFVFKCIAYKISKFNLSSSLSLLLPFYLPY